MVKTKSGRGRYVLAAVLAAMAGGCAVALAPRVVPKAMSAMCARMHAMQSELSGADCSMSDMCQCMPGNMEQAARRASCHAAARQAAPQDESAH